MIENEIDRDRERERGKFKEKRCVLPRFGNHNCVQGKNYMLELKVVEFRAVFSLIFSHGFDSNRSLAEFVAGAKRL